MLPSFTYVRAKSVKQAVQLLSSGDALIHSGGTDLLGCMRDGILNASSVVSLSRIKGMRGIKRAGRGETRIGAMTTIAEIAAHPLIREQFAALSQAASEVASPQLRNQGTVGGNICQKPRCWYYRGEFHCLRKGGEQCFAFAGENQFHCIFGGERCFIVHPSDTAPALVALDAKVRIQGPEGRKEVPMGKFHVLPRTDVRRETVLGPGEIVTEIVLPPAPPGLRSSYRKVRARRSWDFALAGVALALVWEGDRLARARVVLSGAAPVPWRAHEVENIITGGPLNPDRIARAAGASVREAEPLDENGYKLYMFRKLIEAELRAAIPRQG